MRGDKSFAGWFSSAMDLIVAVLGTLAGAIVGSIGTYFTQRSGHERESKERLATARRQIYVDFLTAVHQVYLQIGEIQRQYGDDLLSDEQAELRLRSVVAGNAQSALEHVRLVGGDSVAASAASLWTRLRRDLVPTGLDLRPDAIRAWSATYWNARRDFIDSARADTGFGALDWKIAGVGSKGATGLDA